MQRDTPMGSAGRRYRLDVGSIVLASGDFGRALRSIVPAGQRALAPPGRALPALLRPLLEGGLQTSIRGLLRVFPHAEKHTHGRSVCVCVCACVRVCVRV